MPVHKIFVCLVLVSLVMMPAAQSFHGATLDNDDLGGFSFEVEPRLFGPFPATICAESCPVPATIGESSFETEVTVTIWVDDEEHSETVPVNL